MTNSSAIPISETRNVSDTLAGPLVVIVPACGWVRFSAIRTAPKHSGTNAPAVIANTEA